MPAEADDTIVVVGQRKKRKRLDSGVPSVNVSGTQGESEVRSARKKKRKEEKGKAKVLTPEIQTFDYATAPNILDYLPVEEEGVVQKVRGARKGRGGSKQGKKQGEP